MRLFGMHANEQTVDFRVQKAMPLPYLQLMVELVRQSRPELDCGQLSGLVYLVCDIYYLHREHIHKKMR